MFRKFLNQQIVRYIFAGGSAYVIELGTLFGLYYFLGLSTSGATAIAFWIGLAASFGLQKLLAFKDYQKALKAISRQITLYLILVFVNYVFTIAVVTAFPDKYLLVSRTLALAITTIWNFLIYKKLIFKTGKESATKKPYKQQLKRFAAYIHTNKLQFGFSIASLLLLVGVSTYAAIQSSPVFATNADAIVNTYLAKDGLLETDQIRVVPNHTNAMKFPLLWLQAQFAYNYTAFVIGTSITVIATSLLWCLVLTKLFGKRQLGIIALSLSFFLFLSPILQFNLGYSTVRNIEFPAALYFILVFSKFLTTALTKKLKFEILFASILFTLVMASDKYFLYVVGISLSCIGYAYALLQARYNKRYQTALKATLVPFLMAVSLLFIKLLEVAGFFVYDKISGAKIAFVTKDLILPSLKIAGKQLLDMTGANVFDRPVSLSLVAAASSFIIVLLCIFGLALAAKKQLPFSFKAAANITPKGLMLVNIAAITAAAVGIYIASSQVVTTLPDGTVVNAGQERYLAIVPFLLIAGLVWLYTNSGKIRLFRIGIVTILVLGMAAGARHTHAQYQAKKSTSERWQRSFSAVADALEQEKSNVVLTGHWYGATVRFWSEDMVITPVVQGCNQQVPFLIRAEWYAPKSNNKSAVLVDRYGVDRAYLNCPEEDIITIFGPPYKRMNVPGTAAGSSAEVLFYNYDVRHKLQEIPLE